LFRISANFIKFGVLRISGLSGIGEIMAATEEATIPVKAEAKPGYFKRIWAGLSVIFASKIAVVGLAIVLFWVIVAIFAPLFTPYTPLEQDWKAPNQGPSIAHILGTDELGRDIWSRLIYGARVVLVLMPITENLWIPGGTAIWGVIVALIIGSTLGLLGGYYGGWIDEIIMRLLDAMMAVPIILLYMIIMAALGASALNVVPVWCAASPWIFAPGNTSGLPKPGEKARGTSCLWKSFPMHGVPSSLTQCCAWVTPSSPWGH
jgi:ABC-type dipeptide/oligopeptide/nickel transport system permease subunit